MQVESSRKQAEYERREAELLRKKNQEKNQELEALLQENRRLQEIVTICAWSGKIKFNDEWVKLEEYLRGKFNLNVTHGASPDVAERLLEQSRKKNHPDQNSV